jgi:hypothetical protein
MHAMFVDTTYRKFNADGRYFCKRLCPLRGKFKPYGAKDHHGDQAKRAKIAQEKRWTAHDETEAET